MNPDLSLIVGAGHYRRSSPTPTTSIKVVSWNIQFGVEIEAATELLRDTVELQDADVVLLQEMDEAGTSRMAEALELDYVYGAPGPHAQSGRDFGNAVLSRWPLSAPDVFRLPHQAAFRGQERVLVTTSADIGGTRVRVGSVHTEVPSLSSSKRRRQFEEISRQTAGSSGDRLIIGGDFNTLTSRGVALVTSRLAAIGAVRVSGGAGPSLRRGGQEFTLDHVFARGLSPVAAGVIHGSAASDHRPLWIELLPSAVVDTQAEPAI